MVDCDDKNITASVDFGEYPLVLPQWDTPKLEEREKKHV